MVDVARPQLRDDVRLVRDDLDLDGVDAGLALVPVVGILPRFEMALGHPLLQDEGASADRGTAQITLLDDVARHDGGPPAGHAGEQRRARLLRDDPHGVLVRRLDLIDRAQVAAPAGARLRIEDPLVGELHVVGDELAPAVEFHALAELERPRTAVGARAPRLRERGLELAVVAPLDHTVVEQRVDPLAGERLLHNRIETGRLGRLRGDERAPGLRRDTGRRGGRGGGGGERKEPATTDLGAAWLGHGFPRVPGGVADSGHARAPGPVGGPQAQREE